MLSLKSDEGSFEYFGENVQNKRIDMTIVQRTFKRFMRKEYTRKEAITLIKNVVLAGTYVHEERTDYKTYSNELLLYLTQFIKKKSKRSKDYKIIYALYRSQVKKNEREFKHSARGEVIRNLISRIYYIPWDKDKTEHLKNKLLIMLKKSNWKKKFSNEYQYFKIIMKIDN